MKIFAFALRNILKTGFQLWRCQLQKVHDMTILLSYLRCIKGSDHLIIINCTSSIFDSYRGDLNKFVYYPSTVLRYLRQLLVTKLVIDILRFGEDWLFNFKDIQSSNMAYRLASKNRVEHNTMKNYET